MPTGGGQSSSNRTSHSSLGGASTTRSRPVNLRAFVRTFLDIRSSRLMESSAASLPASDSPPVDEDAEEEVVAVMRFDIVLHAICIERWRDSTSRSSG